MMSDNHSDSTNAMACTPPIDAHVSSSLSADNRDTTFSPDRHLDTEFKIVCGFFAEFRFLAKSFLTKILNITAQCRKR